MRLYRSSNGSRSGEWIVANSEEEALAVALSLNKARRARCWKVDDVTDALLIGKYGDSLAELLTINKVGTAFITLSAYGAGWKVNSGGIKYSSDGSKW